MTDVLEVADKLFTGELDPAEHHPFNQFGDLAEISDRTAFVGRRLVRDVVVAAVGFAYAVWTMIGSGMEIIGQGFVLWMIGVPVFVWMRWARRHEHEVIVPFEHPEIVPTTPKDPVKA